MSRRKVRRARRLTDRTMEQAFAELERGNASLALRLARRAREAGGMNPRVVFECAAIEHACGDAVAAEATLRAMLVATPDHAEACALLAELRAGAGRPGAALRWLQRALDRQPDHAAWRRRRDELAAQVAAESAAAASPQDASADAATPSQGAPAGDAAPSPRVPSSAVDGITASVVARGHAVLRDALHGAELEVLRELFAAGDDLDRPIVLHADASGAAGAAAPVCTARWFLTPPPPVVAALREQFFPIAARVANALHERLGDATRHALVFADHRQLGRREAARMLDLPRGAAMPAERTADRRAFPLRLLFDLGAGVGAGPDAGCDDDADIETLRLVDVRPGRKERATTARTRRGDGVLFCCRARLQAIAGVFGLQLVRWSVGPVTAERLLLDLPFDGD